jgi:hypothetical protein
MTACRVQASMSIIDVISIIRDRHSAQLRLCLLNVSMNKISGLGRICSPRILTMNGWQARQEAYPHSLAADVALISRMSLVAS